MPGLDSRAANGGGSLASRPCGDAAVSAPSVQAQGGSSSVTKAFNDCLLSQAQNGSYTSSDGGVSAIRLMGQCEAQWNAWQDQCIAAGGDTDGDCTLKAAMLAQSALKMRGK
jgi:hypothetical protein